MPLIDSDNLTPALAALAEAAKAAVYAEWRQLDEAQQLEQGEAFGPRVQGAGLRYWQACEGVVDALAREIRRAQVAAEE